MWTRGPCRRMTINDNSLGDEYNTRASVKPAHNTAREVIRLGHMLKKRTGGKDYSLTLRWTAGHSGIPGNELADKKAKKAALGLSSDKKSLPPYLRRKLTINPSAVQQNFDAKKKQSWSNE